MEGFVCWVLLFFCLLFSFFFVFFGFVLGFCSCFFFFFFLRGGVGGYTFCFFLRFFEFFEVLVCLVFFFFFRGGVCFGLLRIWVGFWCLFLRVGKMSMGRNPSTYLKLGLTRSQIFLQG